MGLMEEDSSTEVQREIVKVLGDHTMSIVAFLANEIYYQKCLYHNVNKLSTSDELGCLLEALQALPTFLDTYKKWYEYALRDCQEVSTGECCHLSSD